MIRTGPSGADGGWAIEGRKWFITGAGAAQHFILIARTSDDPRRGLTAFLFDRDQPGWEIVRRIPIMGPEEHGGHCELVFDGLEVADENVLMGVGDGLKVTQIRLGPARLTHCMRWLGLAQRCAGDRRSAYVDAREAFGTAAGRPRERADASSASAAMAIEIGRLLVHEGGLEARPGRARAQGDLDGQGRRSPTRCTWPPTRRSSSTARAAIPRTRSLEWIYRYARQARLVDGASEVHEMVIANAWRERGLEFWA